MTDTEVLLAAADLIERNGLNRWSYWRGWPAQYRTGVPVCALGALRIITGYVYGAAMGAVKKVEAAIGGPMGPWSDSHTQAEVVATLRTVAASEET